MSPSSQNLLRLGLLVIAASLRVEAAQPVVFFLDLESGPNSGGEYDAGVYVTVYGRGFGDTGYVTIGAGRATAYPVWTDSKVTFQLGQSATTGQVAVYAAGATSNALLFTVRPGRIYFVSTTGSDAANGSSSAPWATVQHARDSMLPGDTTYVRNSVTASTNDDWSACLILGGQSGIAGRPLAMIGYPGESPTIGNVAPTAKAGCDSGIRTKGQGEHYWVFAGLRIRGGEEAMSLYGVHDWRIIGNDLSCPQGDGPTACLGTGIASNLKLYGNDIHDAGHVGSSALYHGVYLGTESNHIDFGWNSISRVKGCRGLQVYASDGADLFDLQIHDNVVHDTQCDGIILATVDPSKPGGINVYNNLIYNAGQGPNTPEGSGAFYCLNAQGWTNAGTPGSGVIEFYNNTLFNCGSWQAGYDGANGAVTMNGANPAKRLRLRNNIILQNGASPYLAMDDGREHTCLPEDNCSRVFGSNNLFWGNGPAPSSTNLNNSLNNDPLLLNPALANFHLQSASPARSAGTSTPVSTDAEGVLRSTPPDLGALQFNDGLPVTLRCTPAAAVTPVSATCVVSLSTVAATAGIRFTVASDTSEATLPPTVDVAAGVNSASFTASFRSVSAVKQAFVTISAGSSRAAYPIWLLPPGDTTPIVLSATNAASYLADGISPGSLLTVFGLNLDHQGQAMLDSADVPVISALPRQLTVAAPYTLIPGSVSQFRVFADGKSSNSVSLTVKATTPAVFALDASGTGQALAYNGDGTVNSTTRSASKDSLVTLFVTGLGLTTPVGAPGQAAVDPLQHPIAAVTVEIGGTTAVTASASAAPGVLTGVFQVVTRIPQTSPSGAAVPVIVRTSTGSSQPGMTIAIQ